MKLLGIIPLFLVLLGIIPNISIYSSYSGHHDHWSAEQDNNREPFSAHDRENFPVIATRESLVAYRLNVPQRNASETSSIRVEKVETKCCNSNCCTMA